MLRDSIHISKQVLFTILSLALLICLASRLTASESVSVKKERELTYVLEPILDKDSLRFRVELSFKGDASGTTKLVLPNRWGGQLNLYKAIQNLQVVSPNAKLVDTDTGEPFVKIITHRPNRMLHIQYDLVQNFAGNPQNETRYRPILQKDYFHLIGHGVWVRPAWDEDKTISVSLEWEKLPKNWKLANSFGANQTRQRFQAAIKDFIHAIYVGGDFRLVSLPVAGKPVYTALRGSWQFSDEAFSNLVRRIVTVEREFWRDHNVPYYLVTLIPLEAPPNVTNSGGTGLTNSFALFFTRDAELNDFKSLLAHEYFHNWNAQKLGRLKEPEQQLYWFSEGFTDYYTYLLLLRGGLISLDEFIQKYNSLIREYYFLPVRTESNERVVKDFWNDGDVQKLPYRRGFLLATNWNALIRTASGGKNSLDDVMRDMFLDAKRSKSELTAELIDKYVSRYSGRSVLPDIQRFVENGELIMPDKNAFGPYIELEIIEEPLFELGLDLDALRTKKIIAGVKEDSAAYRAGLRDRQVVVRRLPIYLGDVTKPVEITIKEGDSERTIKYFPTSRKTVSVPQYKLRSSITDKERDETLRLLGIALSANN